METLARDAKALFNVHLSGRQVTALLTYEKELLEWNQKFNLTAIRDAESIRTKHFLDSFSCVLAWKASPPNQLIDVGTGAGFPGIPLKILYPSLKLTLVESVGKKAMFCQHIVRVLRLEHVEVIQARADIAEFCSVQDTGTNDLYDRSLGVMLDAIRDLARIYRENPDAQLEIPVEKKTFTMEQVAREQVRELRQCGRDGRQQAGVLEAAQQQQPS